MMYSPLVLLVVTAGVIQSSYVKHKQCYEPSSLYEYTLSGEMHDHRGKEVIVNSCNVVLQCMSEGTFDGVDQTSHYCIKLENVIQEMFEVKINQVTMAKTKHLKGASDVSEDMRNDFCFLRSKNGSLLKIFHPKNEKTDVVNLKKTIVSAFQANFAKTKSKVETDVQSKHTSHYKYKSKGRNTVEHRTVNSKDVSKYAGKAKKKGVDYHSEEDVEVDSKKTIRRAQGESITSLSKENKQEEKVEGKNSDIPPIEAKSKYTLRLIKRLSPIADVSSMDEPTILEPLDDEATIMDDIMAQYDEYEDDMANMEELHDQLTDIEEMARRMTKRSMDSNDTEATHIEDHIRAQQKWRELLHLELKHGPMNSGKPKMKSIIEKLQEVWFDDTDHSSTLRMIIYDLLSNEGSTAAQQALMNSLRIKQMTEHNEEYNSIVTAIGLLETIDLPSLVDYKQYVLANGSNDDQLLLSLATLGRHKNVEQEVVDTITEIIEEQQGVNDTNTLIYFIHALGNTGSKLIIPHLTPLLLNEELQVTVIDALRTVSTDKRVQMMFTDLCDSTNEASTVLAIIDSIRFPHESFLYYPDPPEEPEDEQVEQQLLTSIVNATIRIQDETLYNATKKYLHAVETEFSLMLFNNLIAEYHSSNSSHRSKRSFTNNWADSSSIYNHVSSYYSRVADKRNYKYNKAFLWVKKLGPSKVHVSISAGGFAGAGRNGYKTYGKVFAHAYCFGRTYTALDGNYLTTYNFKTKAKEVKKYLRLLGTTYIDSSASTQGRVRLPYRRTWSKNLWSKRLFYVQIRIPIWIGMLRFYLQGDVTIDSKLSINMEKTKANANLQAGPTFVITGGASYTILKYQVGISVEGRLGYYLKPQASVTMCDTAPRADVSTCFGVLHGSSGLKVTVQAYYKSFGCRIRRWSLRCRWSGPRYIGWLSSTFNVGRASNSLLWGRCYACSCYGRRSSYCTGSPPSGGVSSCNCRSTTFQ